MRYIFLLFAVFFITACSKEQIKISGKIHNAENKMLYLEEVNLYNTSITDSVKLNKNGSFSFKFKSPVSCFYQLRLTPAQTILLFPNPGDKIKVDADATNILTSLKIKGSHDTEQITKLICMLDDTKVKMDSISVLYEKTSDEIERGRLNKEYQSILDKHRKASVAYILTNYNSLSSIYALYQQYQPGYYVFYKTSDLQYFQILSDSLSKYHAGSPHVESLKAYTAKLVNDYHSNKLLSSGNISNLLPEVKLPDLSGDSVSLYNLKGKYVLLSFWSSKSEPSVKLNLQLKKIYNQYRTKGFEILQVSFDNSAEEWERAVRFDELPWISVIDQKFPNTRLVGNYNIQQLPANYLIDKDNVNILAKNLSASQLKDKLEDLIK